jgi:hypothetical protein
MSGLNSQQIRLLKFLNDANDFVHISEISQTSLLQHDDCDYLASLDNFGLIEKQSKIMAFKITNAGKMVINNNERV